MISQRSTTINKILFTSREIDVIACIVHDRGVKKIANILNVSPRTIEGHIKNILLKIGSNSQEDIKDFVESSSEGIDIKKYYMDLKIQQLFIFHLHKIAVRVKGEEVSCIINYADNKNLKYIADVFVSAKINVLDKAANRDVIKDYTILEVTKDNIGELKNKISLRKKLYVFFDPRIRNELQEFSNVQIIDCSNKEEIHSAIFNLIKIISPTINIDDLIVGFTQLIDSTTKFNHDITAKSSESSVANNSKTKKEIVGFSLLMSIITIGFAMLLVKSCFVPHESRVAPTSISVNLLLPNKDILLDRIEVNNNLDQLLAKSENINIAILLGIGGSGKTTIARNYAHKYKSSIIWEVNADSQNSIIMSFELLAETLIKTENDKRDLQSIQNTSNAILKEQKLLTFISSKLRDNSNWLLIYDNVENVQDIKSYMPHDSKIWGDGKVIVTSRNSNIIANSYIDSTNVINVSELSVDEARNLFEHINRAKKGSDNQEIQEKILQIIPAFPLDISIAANYIKENHLTYAEYLNLLENELLTDTGDHGQVRYSIVASAVKTIMDKNPVYADLFMFISMVNSQNIPKELLVKYSDLKQVTDFMREMRAYSLITEQEDRRGNINSMFAIHRTTQEIILHYLQKQTGIVRDSDKVESMSKILESYIRHESEKQTISQKRQLLLHIGKFLAHDNLSKNIRINLGDLLANYYRYVADYNNAKLLFDRTISIARDQGKNNKLLSELLEGQGAVYRDVGEYHRSSDLLLEALKLKEKEYGKNHIESANNLTRLGKVYFDLGDCRKSQEYFDSSLKITKQHYGETHNKTILALLDLSRIYTEIGEYDKVKEILESNLGNIITYYGEDNYRTAFVWSQIGTLYIKFGNYNEANELLKKAQDVMVRNYGIDHFTSAKTMLLLANTHMYLKQYSIAEELLNDSLKILQRDFGREHLETAHALYSLADLYLSKGDFVSLSRAERLLEKALAIYNRSDHYKSYNCLELLSDLSVVRYTVHQQESSIQSKKLAAEYKQKAVNYVTNSLQVAIKHFPQDSLHVVRLQQKSLETKKSISKM